MAGDVVNQVIVPDEALDADPDRVMATCRRALARKARIEGYAIDLDQVETTTRPTRYGRRPSTIVSMTAPTIGERRR